MAGMSAMHSVSLLLPHNGQVFKEMQTKSGSSDGSGSLIVTLTTPGTFITPAV
jgi:hypothetical protein